MELNITEIDRTPTSTYNHNYWDPDIPAQNFNKKAAKPFSYDDILSSLNMVVENGVLKKIHINQPQQPAQIQRTHMEKEQPSQQQRIITPQEKREILMQYRIKQLIERRRVEHAKPAKMLFNRYNNAAPINTRNRMGRMFF
jgi:hypothetical protein